VTEAQPSASTGTPRSADAASRQIQCTDMPRRERGDWQMLVTDGKWPDEAGASGRVDECASTQGMNLRSHHGRIAGRCGSGTVRR